MFILDYKNKKAGHEPALITCEAVENRTLSREDNAVPSTCLVDFNYRQRNDGNSLNCNLVTVFSFAKIIYISNRIQTTKPK